MTVPSLQVGEAIRVTDLGKRYLGDFIDVQRYLEPNGDLVGKLVKRDVFSVVTLDRIPNEEFLMGNQEIEAYQTRRQMQQVALTDLVELLTIYRMSDDDEEVMTAQQLLIEMYLGE